MCLPSRSLACVPELQPRHSQRICTASDISYGSFGVDRWAVRHAGQLPFSQSIGASERRAKHSAGSASRDLLWVPDAQPKQLQSCSFTVRRFDLSRAASFIGGNNDAT